MVGRVGLTPSIRSVNRYSWAIGTIGTSTPASRPISGANMPPAFTTTSAAIDRSWPSLTTRTPRTRPARTSIPTTRLWVSIRTPRLRAPAAIAWARPDGSSQPSVGR